MVFHCIYLPHLYPFLCQWIPRLFPLAIVSSDAIKIVVSVSFLVIVLSRYMPWSRRRQWHPTPVLLPGKSHGWRSLGGCSPWGRKESNMTSLSLFTFMHWRRKWQPTPVFLPGESQGRGSLVGCCLWGCIESDMTGVT